MKHSSLIAHGVLACACLGYSVLAPAQSAPVSTSPVEAVHAPQGHDGQHDFDFQLGAWKTHIRRLVHPLTGSTTWAELDGTVVVHKLWDGRAQWEELAASGTGGRFDEFALLLYDPKAHQWSVSYANRETGVLSVPIFGEFHNGRGEFYDQEPIGGRMVMVRGIYSEIKPNSHQFEQAFSDDGGKSWETNFIATLTRDAP